MNMRIVRSLRKEFTNFCFTRLIQNVKSRKHRPFYIDEQGLWFKTKYGFFIHSNLKDRILELDINAAWEEMESSFILDNLKDGDVFVDVGANIGYFSMLAARQKAGKVLAIEPTPKTYDMLNINIKYNMFTDVVETFNFALGSEIHTAKLVPSLGPKSHMEYKTDNIHSHLSTIDVKVTTLDNLIKDNKEITRVDFIKVDIEGAEYNFLLGARKTIEVFKPMILMEIEEQRLTKYNATAEKIFNFMEHLNYKYLSVTEDLIAKGSSYQEDLEKGRNFIFFNDDNHPIY